MVRGQPPPRLNIVASHFRLSWRPTGQDARWALFGGNESALSPWRRKFPVFNIQLRNVGEIAPASCTSQICRIVLSLKQALVRVRGRHWLDIRHTTSSLSGSLAIVVEL